jgi:hypothetical protein
MTNSFYNHGTTPATGSSGSSALVRAEFDAVSAGFALMPQLAGAGYVWRTNAGNSSGESVSLATLINGAYLPTAGGVMAGILDMGGNQVLDVANIGGYSDSQAYTIWGGKTSLNGGAIQLYGASHATYPNNLFLMTNGVSFMRADGSGNAVFSQKLKSTGSVTTGGDVASQYVLVGNNCLCYVDPSRSANNKQAEFSFFSGALFGRFLSDNYAAASQWLQVTGGQAGGVSAITLSTGAGVTALAIDANQQTTLTTSGASKTLALTDTGVNGANLLMTGNGSTTPRKYLRVQSGAFQVLNDAYTVALLSLSDVGQLAVAGGIIDSAGNPYTQVITKVKTSTTTRTSTTTLADDPQLAGIPLSVGTWTVEAMVPFYATVTSTACGFKTAIGFTGTRTNDMGTYVFTLNSALTASSLASGTGVGVTGSSAISTNGTQPDFMNIRATFTVTVAGNVSLQWAQGTSSAVSLNMLVGGYMICTKTA